MSRSLARLGTALSALGVFTCGWLAMQTSDWRLIVAYSMLALGAGALASAFSRRAR
jgi:NADH:ubiquinone oxidoreductase subunit 4 (subunit M)